ncbi:hypothetical protein [Allocoleopsis sp.]|uniref:hypothetical protein n=1 Tax=Allocoleopsis sp. TaxID=3088169 RepID=UPI002FD3CC8C
MFEAENTQGRSSSAAHIPDTAALTQKEVADLIRLTETYGISGADQIKLILRIRDLKKRAYAKLKKN